MKLCLPLFIGTQSSSIEEISQKIQDYLIIFTVIKEFTAHLIILNKLFLYICNPNLENASNDLHETTKFIKNR